MADGRVSQTPEIQGISTTTLIDAVGTVSETDSLAWVLMDAPLMHSVNNQSMAPNELHQQLASSVALWNAQLQPAGGSIEGFEVGGGWFQPTQYNIPDSLWDTFIPGTQVTWKQWLEATNGVFTTKAGIHEGALSPGEVQVMTTYSDKLTAIDGFVTWKKDAMVTTADQLGTPNVQMDATLQFDSMDGTGRAVREESLMLDTVANERATISSVLCPFAVDKSSTIPKYCNYVTMGSKVDTSLTNTVTQAKESFVGAASDFPVTMNYQIAAKGLTYDRVTFPMSGTASAALVVDIKEARNGTGLAETLVYKETSTASGSISSFNKAMNYQSGLIIH